jgi:hypothetical protein
MKLRSLFSFALASSLFALAGCESQTEPTYKGEPLDSPARNAAMS